MTEKCTCVLIFYTFVFVGQLMINAGQNMETNGTIHTTLIKSTNTLFFGLVIKPSSSTQTKRPMGHIAHLRKEFKSINTYDYIITMIKRRKKTL